MGGGKPGSMLGGGGMGMEGMDLSARLGGQEPGMEIPPGPGLPERTWWVSERRWLGRKDNHIHIYIHSFIYTI